MRVFKKKSMVVVHGALEPTALKMFKCAASDIVVCLEGRPSLDAGKHNAKGLSKKGIVPYMITDNMAGSLFFNGLVKRLVLACQYADKSGALCDSGALLYCLLARRHHVPVVLTQGRVKKHFLGDPKSILYFEEELVAPKNTKGYVPLVEWVERKYLQ